MNNEHQLLQKISMSIFIIFIIIISVSNATNNNSITCTPDSRSPCVFGCKDKQWPGVSCVRAILECRPGVPCTVDCDNAYCQGIVVQGSAASSLNITGCIGGNHCQNMDIHCPSTSCFISGSFTGLKLNEGNCDCYSNGMSGLNIFASNSFDDIDFSGFIGTMRCSAVACRMIAVDSNWRCENLADLCNILPTALPTNKPTKFPTLAPTINPTPAHTNKQTKFPTYAATIIPTASPTHIPSTTPTQAPTTHTNVATMKPTNIPSETPTVSTSYPSQSPTMQVLQPTTSYPSRTTEAYDEVEQQNHIYASSMTYIFIAIGCVLCVISVFCIFCCYKINAMNKESNVSEEPTEFVGSNKHNNNYNANKHQPTDNMVVKSSSNHDLSGYNNDDDIIPKGHNNNIGKDELIVHGDDNEDDIIIKGYNNNIGTDEFIVHGDDENNKTAYLSESKGNDNGNMSEATETSFSPRHVYSITLASPKLEKDMFTIKTWLETTVGLVQYHRNFIDNGYDTLEFISEITDRGELFEIGILSNQHQIKILNEIRNLNNDNEHLIKATKCIMNTNVDMTKEK